MKSTQPSPWREHVSSLSILRAVSLITPRRLDLAVKHRYFLHLTGGNDPESEVLYAWHIGHRSGERMEAGVATDKWKTSVDDYLAAASQLHISMQESGFSAKHPIPVDPNGEILDGSHRLACALALGIKGVPVIHTGQLVWAPIWGCDWFICEGMSLEDVGRLEQDLEMMKQ